MYYRTINANAVKVGDRIRRRSRYGLHVMTVESVTEKHYVTGASMVTVTGLEALNGYASTTPRRLAFGGTEQIEVAS